MTKIYHLEHLRILRDAFSAFVAGFPSVKIVGESALATDFLRDAATSKIELLLLDLELDTGLHGPLKICLELCDTIQQLYPGMLIIVHAPFSSGFWVDRFLHAGVTGFVSKHSGAADMMEVIDEVATGATVMCPVLAGQFSNYTAFKKDPAIPLKLIGTRFSKRETEVLQELVKGHSTKQIAQSLFVSDKTIETHRHTLIEKAKVKNTAELISFACMKGMIYSWPH